METKSLHEWIEENRRRIDDYINKTLPNRKREISDKDRYSWVLNFNNLYYLARSEGVEI